MNGETEPNPFSTGLLPLTTMWCIWFSRAPACQCVLLVHGPSNSQLAQILWLSHDTASSNSHVATVAAAAAAIDRVTCYTTVTRPRITTEHDLMDLLFLSWLLLHLVASVPCPRVQDGGTRI